MTPRLHPRATVFRTSRAFVIRSDGRTSAGVNIGVSPIEVVDSPEALGPALQSAFDVSITVVVPHPRDWSTYVSPLDSVAEYRRGRKRTFGLRGCVIDADSEFYRVIPMTPLNRYNWGFDEDAAVVLPRHAALSVLADTVVAVLATSRRL